MFLHMDTVCMCACCVHREFMSVWGSKTAVFVQHVSKCFTGAEEGKFKGRVTAEDRAAHVRRAE